MSQILSCIAGYNPGGLGGGLLPSNRLIGMCRWMGLHFHNWIDYNRVAFSKELLEWGHTFFGILGVRKFWQAEILSIKKLEDLW